MLPTTPQKKHTFDVLFYGMKPCDRLKVSCLELLGIISALESDSVSLEARSLVFPRRTTGMRQDGG